MGTLLNHKITAETVTIIAGGDPDGALVAGIVKTLLEAQQVSTVVLYNRVTPCILPEDAVCILVDLPVDMRKPRTEVTQWLIEHQNQLLLVVDHHQGDDIYKEVLGDKVITGTAASCPGLLLKLGAPVNELLSEAADALDDLRCPSTPLSTVLRKHFDMALSDLQIGNKATLDSALRAFTSLAEQLTLAEIQGKRYAQLEQDMDAAITRAKITGHSEVTDTDVVILQILQGETLPLTSMFSRLYDIAPVAIIQSFGRNNAQLTTVAHKLGGQVNLVSLLGLQSGSGSRIPLIAGHEEDLGRIKNALKIQ